MADGGVGRGTLLKPYTRPENKSKWWLETSRKGYARLAHASVVVLLQVCVCE